MNHIQFLDQPKPMTEANSNIPLPNEPPTYNLKGKVLGRKGQLTRARLIATLENMLKHRPLRELRVMDICREAKTAPGTFYLYFEDVEGLALEAIRKSQELPTELSELLDSDWPRDQAFDFARRFISGYVAYWEEHYHLLHTRNLTADEGNLQMIELRHSCVVPLLERIANKIRSASKHHQDDALNPVAGATVIMGSLERLAAVFRFHVSQRSDVSSEDFIDAEAWVLARMLGQDHITRPSRV